MARLRIAVAAAATGAGGDEAGVRGASIVVERPKQEAHGDYATNAAMIVGPARRTSPREAAEQIRQALTASLADDLDAAEVAGPGFLNLRLSAGWHMSSLAHVVAAGDRFGSGVIAPRERVLVEFVSANPTGPMHIGHGRNAAYGDALCRVLEFAGHRVEREFYVNDLGSQIIRFGDSIAARARGEQPAEDGYHGDYVVELAGRVDGAATAPAEQVALRGVELMVQEIRATLERLRVSVDSWFSERSLQASGQVDGALGQLAAAGHSYEQDGALWLRTSALGDDKDRVLRRSSGELTYFATDIAYHQDKRARGFDRLIDVWGADHHGYVARMRAAFAAFGGDPDRLEPVIMQLVNIKEDGRRAQMSKRTGEFVAIDDLIDDIGVDAVRFFLLQRSHDTAIDLDLELARDRSQANPMYYLQYAHARIASILRRAGADRTGAAIEAWSDAERASSPGAGVTELHPSERALIRRLLEFPDQIAEIAARRAPHLLTVYGRDLAADYSAFYRDCNVIDAEPVALLDLRLALCAATRGVLARTLDLLAVAAPDEM